MHRHAPSLPAMVSPAQPPQAARTRPMILPLASSQRRPGAISISIYYRILPISDRFSSSLPLTLVCVDRRSDAPACSYTAGDASSCTGTTGCMYVAPGAAVISYAVSVTSTNILDSSAVGGLAAVVRALDSEPSDGSLDTSTFISNLVTGINAAFLTEEIAQASFIAGISLLPLAPGCAVDTTTPDNVLSAVGSPFVSEVTYLATSLGTLASLTDLLTRRNLNTALMARARAGSWAPPTLGALHVAQPPTPPPPAVEGIGAASVLAVCLCILSCVGLVVREIKRRRMRKSHRVYVEDAKAKDDVAREAAGDEERKQREEVERRKREAAEKGKSHLLIYQSAACFTDLSIAGMFY